MVTHASYANQERGWVRGRVESFADIVILVNDVDELGDFRVFGFDEDVFEDVLAS